MRLLPLVLTLVASGTALADPAPPPSAPLPANATPKLAADKAPTFSPPPPTGTDAKLKLVTDRPFEAAPKTFVNPPWLRIDYTDADGSEIEAGRAFAPALEKAGWSIVNKDRDGGIQVA